MAEWEEWCLVNSVQQTVDGGFVITGSVGYDEVLLLKTDSQGNEEWEMNLGDGTGSSVQQTVDGSFVVTGSVGNEVLLIKTDKIGHILND